jgi:acyl-CoA hydrolase
MRRGHSHIINININIITNTGAAAAPAALARIHKRCFQSRAEYEEWTHRMKTSRMIINNNDNGNDSNDNDNVNGNDNDNEDHDDAVSCSLPRLTQVNAKTAAPFLYSVSPISDRLLLYAHHETANTTTSSSGSSVSSSSGKSPSSSMLECIYPLSESRYTNHHHNHNHNHNHQNDQDDDQHGSSTSETILDKKADASYLDILRASVSDPTLSSFRLAKFYSDVDALTADVAYRHAASNSNSNSDTDSDTDTTTKNKNNKNKNNNIAFVTAGHYHSRKIHQTDISNDIILRCYPTHTGGASMEIRTDALQRDEQGKEILVNVCFTSMVAVDPDTLRPVKNVIPKLIYSNSNSDSSSSGEEESRQRIRTEMAQQHGQIRKERFATSMQLRHGPSSSPPTQQEMTDIHALHQRVIMNHHPDSSINGNGNVSINGNGSINGADARALPHVHQHTYRSSVVVYPEKRNVHGKLFGGFVMEQGHILAQYAADFYLDHSQPKNKNKNNKKNNSTTNHNHSSSKPNGKQGDRDRAIPLGLDEAIFLQPIGIGDHVTFTARVVHSTPRTCRIVVIVEVRDPADRHSAPLRSNRLSFLFGGSGFPNSGVSGVNGESESGGGGGGIVPDGYNEILMHVDAKRRMDVEGPLDEEVERILSEV